MAESQEEVPPEVTSIISDFIVDTCKILTEASLRLDEVDYVLSRINSVELMLTLCADSIDVNPMVFQAISQAKDLLSSLSFEGSATTANQATKLFSGDRGRPRFVVTKEQLEFFINYGFHCPEIGRILNISESTVRRRLKEFGISANNFTRLTDGELDSVVEEIKRDFPDSGYRMVLGQLRARNLHVQENRVRESLRRVDMEGVISRTCALRIIRRRRYRVSGPNALWHVDTNHKLIR